MNILLVSLPLLAVIALANVIAARASAGVRLAFNLALFVVNLLLVLGGLALLVIPQESLTLPEAALQSIDPRSGGAAFIIMGLWGAAVSLSPVRRGLKRILPALEPDSPVHTLALVGIGYLAGSALLSMAPGALEAILESGVQPTLVDVLAQQFVFVLVAFFGVGLLTRRDGRALNERLGLLRPTRAQLWLGVRWMLFFVFLQACIGASWALFNPAAAEELGGVNELLLGNINTVWDWLLLALAAGLGEEMLFRGALQPVFGILATSIVFAVSHIQYGLSPATLVVFLLSVVLGIIRKRTNTTVAIFVHAGYNFILGMLSILAVYLAPYAQ